MSKIKIAIIGFGGQTREDHYQEIVNNQNFELVGIVDPNQVNVEPYFSSLDELLDSNSVEAALVSTPHFTHYEITEKLLKSGIAVLKEKPFGMNYDEAKQLDKLAKEHTVPLLINAQRRLKQHYIDGLELLPQIGKPFLVEGVYHIYVNNPHEGWRGQKKLAGGGCIIDMGYHLIDILNLYLGLPDSVAGLATANALPREDYDAEDTATLLIGYTNKIAGYLTFSRFSGPKNEFLKITGDSGVLTISKQEVLLTDNSGKELQKVNASQAITPVQHFFEVLSQKKESVLASENHLNNMAFIDAAYQAIESKSYMNPHKILEKI